VTHRSRRRGNCRPVRPSRNPARARRNGPVVGVECKSGFRQTWEWLGEKVQRVRLHVGLTSLRLLLGY
jgi:hypothetical protein